MKLRNNWALQEVVDSFKNARPRVLEFMNDAIAAADAGPAGGGMEEEGLEQPVTKRRRIAPSRNKESGTSPRTRGRKTRSQSKKLEEAYDGNFVVEDSQDEDYETEPEPEPEPSTLPTYKLFHCASSYHDFR